MTADSTPFITYSEIEVEEIDLYDDAWGFHSEFHDVFNALGPAEDDRCKPLSGRGRGIVWDIN